MVQILAPLFGAAILFSGVMAAPRPDSSINEPAVSSPNGIPITEGAAIGTPQAAAYNAPMATTSAMMSEATSSAMKMKEESSSMMVESSSAKMMDEATSTMMKEEATSTMMKEEATSTMMKEEATSTKMYEATSTSAPTSTMYGSGSSGNSGYDNCVMQCMNTYGAPAAQYTPPPSTATDSGSGGGSGGSTHTVIVAPMKGVLRFVPFALNASVGDTIHYVWGAGPHTVTQSSILEPCNKTATAAAFNSGQRNATATFDQAVNDTNPVFFYCNVPGHCQKGMFGVVNPPNAAAATTSTTVAQMMPQWIANSTTIATLAMYTNNQTKGTTAANWGDNIDVATIPTWAHAALAENVMYTRLLFAANPGMLEAGAGAGYPDGKPYTLPSANFDTLAASTPDAPAANAGAAGSSSEAAPSATSDPTAAASSPSASQKSGASAVSSSALLVGVIAIAATFFAL